MFTKTTLFHKPNEGGGSGGDQHNLGWYATPEALRTAHATATAGDWAIVGSTDTVWIWDTDTNAWKDSDQKGQVTSVNGQTGAVVIDALQNTATGSDTLTISGSPNSNANSVNIGIGSVADYNGVSIGCNAGKNTSSSVNITGSVFIGMGAQAFRNSTDCRYSIGIGQGAEVKDAKGGISIGWGSGVYSERAIGIGHNARASAFHSIQLGSLSSGTTAVNNDANTFKVANANGNFEIMSADGTIPEARLADTTNAQQGDVLTLDSNGNAVWQAGGSGGGLPDQTGQSGKFLTTDGTDASWSDKPLVNKATVSGSLVVGDNATDEGCDEVTILGSSATVGSSFFSGSIAIGSRASVMGGGNSIVIGECAESRGDNTVVIGYSAKATAEGAIQLGTGGTNSDANTFKVWNNNGNFEIMSADGTIPAARHAALPSADGTYVLKLVIADGVPTLSWVAE
jgi:hypothetical protein